jgi:hypothetical protein
VGHPSFLNVPVYYNSGIFSLMDAVKREEQNRIWATRPYDLQWELNILGYLRKIAILVLTAVTMTCLIWPMYLDRTLAHTMPTTPQVSQGRIYRIVVNHGSIIYVNEKEFRQANLAFNTIFMIAIVSAGLLGMVFVYWKAGGPDAK